MEWMIADLDELRERIAAWPEEEQAAALFALEVIEDCPSSDHLAQLAA